MHRLRVTVDGQCFGVTQVWTMANENCCWGMQVFDGRNGIGVLCTYCITYEVKDGRLCKLLVDATPDDKTPYRRSGAFTWHRWATDGTLKDSEGALTPDGSFEFEWCNHFH